ncbi:hypothetical protein [Myxosarcina sp. GI1(2024)]
MKNYALLGFLLGTTALLPFGIDSSRQAIAQQEQPDATIEGITDSTGEWLGKTVTVTGTIENVQEGAAFTIEDEAYLDSERILVINRSGQPIPELPAENVALQVTGTVERVKATEFIEGRDVNLSSDNVPSDLMNKPAIFAESIILAPDPREVIEVPSNYYNREVVVEGKVAEILSDNAFTLAQLSYALPEDKDLLVLNLTSEPMPTDQAEVSIKGIVRPYDRQQLERDYGAQIFTEELDEKYSNAGVLIVESISPVNVDASEVEVDVTPTN